MTDPWEDLTVRPGITVRPGMTRQERAIARERYRRRLVADAEAAAATVHRSGSCVAGRHETCVGEQPGNGGCLCECHDR